MNLLKTCWPIIRYVLFIIIIKLYSSYICLILWRINFHGFLSMVIYEALAICLRYNICSAWFLDIRISTYSVCGGWQTHA